MGLRSLQQVWKCWLEEGDLCWETQIGRGIGAEGASNAAMRALFETSGIASSGSPSGIFKQFGRKCTDPRGTSRGVSAITRYPNCRRSWNKLRPWPFGPESSQQ
jgi:hypothetical protein